ncbi:MAG: type II secretion system F family protein [Pseudomonadota bacterium]
MVEPISWTYLAETQTGAHIRGRIIAVSETQALQHLRDQHLKPFDLRPIQENSVSAFSKRSSKLSAPALTTLVKAMSDLLEAGIPLGETLGLLEQREKSGVAKALIQRLKSGIRNGERFSVALANDPANLPRLMIAMVEAGEATGTLDTQLTRFAETQERNLTLRRDLVGQTLYPLVLCLLVTLTIFFLSYLVLPEFETIFSDGETRIPPETKFILDAGAWIRSWGATIPLIMGTSLIAGQFAWRRCRPAIEPLLLSLPGIGSFLLTLESGRFCRGLGVMLEGGMAIVPAFAVARKTVGFDMLRHRLDRASSDVRSGNALSSSLETANALHSDSLRFIELGERTGELGAMVTKAASHNEAAVKTILKRFTDLLSPVLTIFMGLITAGVIGAVMSGVLSLNETVY